MHKLIVSSGNDFWQSVRIVFFCLNIGFWSGLKSISGLKKIVAFNQFKKSFLLGRTFNYRVFQKSSKLNSCVIYIGNNDGLGDPLSHLGGEH
jgi:hypothetical protein